MIGHNFCYVSFELRASVDLAKFATVTIISRQSPKAN